MLKAKRKGDRIGKSAGQGNGSGRNGGDFGGSRGANGSFQMAHLGMWLAVGALSMMFGALALLYLARLGEKPNFVFEAPEVLWLSTVLILASSATCHAGLRAVRRGNQGQFRNYAAVTLLLGLLFVASQAYAWVQLQQAGLADPTNPFSVLFWILTGVHAFHVLAGLGWIGYVLYGANRGVFTAKRHLAVDLSSIYWHFMDGVWVVFFALFVFL
ncbi:MAG: heme-copper oxidase subunit III [Armatimonadetes bacterium]|nr:heme-copper oxidase subunit III [Armatimonadota bacterium]